MCMMEKFSEKIAEEEKLRKTIINIRENEQNNRRRKT